MRFRADVLLFAALLSGSAYAVATQIGTDPVAPFAKKAVKLGNSVEDFTLTGIGGTPSSLSKLRGTKATVLYYWSITCPCVDAVEMRIKKAMAKYESQGVAFVAIDSDPDDSKDDVVRKMVNLHAGYTMLLDPKQVTLPRTGARTSTEIVILDASDRIRYRGSIDDNLIKPTVDYLGPALDAILAGKEPSPAETKPYGCPFPGFEGDCEFD